MGVNCYDLEKQGGVGSRMEAELIEAKERRELIERIVLSEHFRKAPRLRDFLVHVASCTLNNRPDDAREQCIAERVFERKAEYAGQDSIVRTEARNLRKRLEAYFENEGKNEPLLVSMPKGGYLLSFQPREQPEADYPVARSGTADLVLNAEKFDPQHITAIQLTERKTLLTGRGYRTVSIVMSLLLILAAALAVHWREEARAFRTQTAETADRTLPFSALFAPARDTYVITSDVNLWQITTLTKQPITIDNYMSRTYPELHNMTPAAFFSGLKLEEYTDGYEMAVAGTILKRNAAVTEHIFLRSGHQVEMSDVKSHDVVILGSPFSNAWAQLYQDRLNFQWQLTGGAVISFRNAAPKAGEASAYPTGPGDGFSYAQIALMPNIVESSHVLLIGGTRGEATSAAAEFVLDEARMSQALRRLGVDPKGAPRSFELLLRVKSYFSGSTRSEVIAARVGPK